MEGRITSTRGLREAGASKKTYLVKFLTYCRDTYEWGKFEVEARTNREACLLASAKINYNTDDLSVLVEDEDFETGEYVMDLTNSQLLDHLRQLNEEQSVYYMKNLTTGQILIDDTADYKDFCGEHFEANTEKSEVMWGDDED